MARVRRRTQPRNEVEAQARQTVENARLANQQRQERERQQSTQPTRQQNRTQPNNQQTAAPSDTVSEPAQEQPRQPRVFRSSDGRVTFNERGQRLDSHGNVARRTNRSRRRDFRDAQRQRAAGQPSDERTTGVGRPSDERTTGLRPTDARLPSPNEGGGATFSEPTTSTFQDAINQTPTGRGDPLEGLNLDGVNQVLNLLESSGVHSDSFFRSADFAEALRRWNLQFNEQRRQAAFQVAGRAQLPNARFL